MLSGLSLATCQHGYNVMEDNFPVTCDSEDFKVMFTAQASNCDKIND